MPYKPIGRPDKIQGVEDIFKFELSIVTGTLKKTLVNNKEVANEIIVNSFRFCIYLVNIANVYYYIATDIYVGI